MKLNIKSTVRILSLVMVFCFTCSTFASAHSEGDAFVLYNEEIANATIQITGNNVITLTTTTISSVDSNTAVISEIENTGPIQAANVSTIALFVNEPKKTEEVYNELVSAAHTQHDYRENGDWVSGLRAHCTVYFTTQYIDGHDWYHFVSIDGGNDKVNASNVIGSGYMIANQYVAYGVWGGNLEGINPVPYDWTDKCYLSKNASTFYIDVENLHRDWPTVDVYNSALGALYTIEIHSTRDNTDIILDVPNYVLSTVQLPIT